MNNSTSERENTSAADGSDDTGGTRHGRMVMGLVAGTMMGIGIGLWLAPHMSTLRRRLDDSARELGMRAAERYEQAGSRVAAAVDGVASSAQNVRDGVADSMASAALKVERLAVATKS